MSSYVIVIFWSTLHILCGDFDISWLAYMSILSLVIDHGFDGCAFACSFCLCYVMQHAGSPEGYVLAKVSSVAAQLMKRGW